jgi:hypothetical protein
MYRHPSEQIDLPSPGVWRSEEDSLAGVFDDTDLATARFSPIRPRWGELGAIPISAIAGSDNPLTFDLRLPSGGHARRLINGSETWRDFIADFEYRVSLELSPRGDLVSVVYDGEFVGFTFVHPIGGR